MKKKKKKIIQKYFQKLILSYFEIIYSFCQVIGILQGNMMILEDHGD